jgi:predicted metal-dependent HD superfamily phosphohydrolase
MLARIRAAYATPPRAYHCWSHVEDVLRRYHEVGSEWEQPTEVLLAVLLHDAVYAAGAADNEERSAELALRLVEQHMPGESLETARIAELIRLTARHGSLTPDDVDADAALFLDCDMAILGSASGVYDRYEAAIRDEYAHLPPDAYAAGRRAFLTALLDSPRIFLSDHFHARLDAAARENLRRAPG